MPSRLSNTVSELTPTKLNRIVIVCLLILLFGGLFKQLSNGYFTHQYEPKSLLTTSSSNKQQSIIDYNASSITSSQLFGLFEGQDSYTSNIPVTSLELKLRGAFTSNQPSLSSAMIEGPDGETRSYRINSKVYGQTELEKVFADRVVLSRNGQLETLYFPTLEESNTSENVNQNSQTLLSGYEIPDDIQSLVQDNMSGQEIKQAAKQLGSASLTPEQRKVLIRQRLEDLRNRARQKK